MSTFSIQVSLGKVSVDLYKFCAKCANGARRRIFERASISKVEQDLVKNRYRTGNALFSP